MFRIGSHFRISRTFNKNHCQYRWLDYNSLILFKTSNRHVSQFTDASVESAKHQNELSPELPIVDDKWSKINVTEESFSVLSATSNSLDLKTDTINTITSSVPETHERLFFPFECILKLLDTVHSSTGLPWWASIAATTIMLRTILFPLTVKARRSTAKSKIIQPKIDYLTKQFYDVRTQGAYVSEYKDEHMEMVKNLQKDAGVNVKDFVLLPLAQIPIFVSMFFAIRNMGPRFPDLQTEGTLWFTDLTAKDPIFVLPALCGVALYGTIQFGTEWGHNEQQQTLKKILTGVCFVTPIATSFFPTSLLCYWVVNNVFSFVQGLLLNRPSVKKMLKIDTVDESMHQEEIELLEKNDFSAPVLEYVEAPLPGRTTYFDNFQQPRVEEQEEKKERIFGKQTRRMKKKYIHARFRLI